MRSIWINAWLALILLGTAPLASAAGFDCAKAKSAVEQRICADPLLSSLDSQMVRVFEQARAKAGPKADALLRDQRNWLRERNDAIMNATSSSPAVFIYQNRIMFLERVFKAPPTDALLVAAIVKHLASQPAGAPLTLGGDGTVFMRALQQPFDPKRLAFETGPLVKMASDIGATPGNAKLFLLDDLQMGVLYSHDADVEGFLSYLNSVALFDWHARVVQRIPVPAAFTDERRGWLVAFQGRAYALGSDESSIAASDIETQKLEDNHSTWTDPVRVLIRYNYRISPRYVHCALTHCVALTALARKVFGRYLRSYDAGTLSGHVPYDVRIQFETLQQEAWNTKMPWADVPNSYVHDGDHYDGFRKFDHNDSAFFPIRWQGEWLWARISRASAPGRSSDDWLLGIWRWNGHAFVPMLGMVAPARRTGFLLAAWLPSWADESYCFANGWAKCIGSQSPQAANNFPAANASK